MDLVSPLRPGLADSLALQTALARERALGEAPNDTEDRWEALAQQHPELFDSETVSKLLEVSAAVPVGQALAAHLSRLHLSRACAHFDRAIAARDAMPATSAGETPVSLAQALERVERAPSREERDTLESAIDLFLRDHSQPELQRFEALQRSASLFRALERPLPEWTPEVAQGFLSATADAYEDVLGYALGAEVGFRRKRPLASVRWHDLRLLARSPLPGMPRGASLVGVAGRWLEAFRLPLPNARALGPRALLLATPKGGGETESVWRVDDGPLAQASFFAELADFQRVLHARSDDPIEAQKLASESVAETHRALFGGLLREPEMLRRFVELPRERTVDCARLHTLVELGHLRAQAGLCLVRARLDQEGPTPALRDLFADTQSRAVRAPVPPALWLRELEPGRPEAHRLAGAAWAQALRVALRERFDEDWFRNPAASTWLTQRYARGARETVDSLSRAIGRSELPAASVLANELATELVATLNR